MIDTKALRCKVLDLAIQGKLTKQLDSDGTAEDILKTISSKKQISQTENVPFDIPNNWRWVKLSDLYKINPPVVADSSSDSAFIPMEKISAGFDGYYTYEVQTWGVASKNHTKFQNGDVAFAKISPCFENRKSFIADNLPNGIGGGTTELIILRQNKMYSKYTYFLVVDQRFITAGSSSYKGVVGQQRVKSDVVKNYLVPVPPFAEQKRIVERVEEIFKLLDIIDEAQKKYSADAEILKSKLITMGIQGKLTKQLDSDGIAEELYQQIQEEKQKLIKEGKIKKEKTLQPVADEEIPFEIPKNWKWVRLGEIVTVLGGKRIPAGRKLTTEDTGHKYIRVSDMKNMSVDTSGLLFVPEDIYPSISRYIINKEDIYITVAGTIGRVGTIPDEIDGANLTENADRLVFTLLYRNWLVYCLSDDTVQKQIIFLTTQVAQPKLAIKKIQEFYIPLPPLAEQKRIADTLDEVLRVIG